MELEPLYQERMKEVLCLPKEAWINQFTDWEYMSLRSDLKVGQDYFLVE